MTNNDINDIYSLKMECKSNLTEVERVLCKQEIENLINSCYGKEDIMDSDDENCKSAFNQIFYPPWGKNFFAFSVFSKNKLNDFLNKQR